MNLEDVYIVESGVLAGTYDKTIVITGQVVCELDVSINGDLVIAPTGSFTRNGGAAIAVKGSLIWASDEWDPSCGLVRDLRELAQVQRKAFLFLIEKKWNPIIIMDGQHIRAPGPY